MHVMNSRPQSIRSQLEQPVRVSTPTRLLLASVVSAGGLAFIGFAVSFALSASAASSSFTRMAFVAVIATFGAGFLLVGWRLFKPSAASGQILGPTARKVCGTVVGAFVPLFAVLAWQGQSVLVGALTGFAAFFAYSLFRQAVPR